MLARPARRKVFRFRWTLAGLPPASPGPVVVRHSHTPECGRGRRLRRDQERLRHPLFFAGSRVEGLTIENHPCRCFRAGYCRDAWDCGLSDSETTHHRLASNRRTSHFFIQDHVKAAFALTLAGPHLDRRVEHGRLAWTTILALNAAGSAIWPGHSLAALSLPRFARVSATDHTMASEHRHPRGTEPAGSNTWVA